MQAHRFAVQNASSPASSAANSRDPSHALRGNTAMAQPTYVLAQTVRDEKYESGSLMPPSTYFSLALSCMQRQRPSAVTSALTAANAAPATFKWARFATACACRLVLLAQGTNARMVSFVHTASRGLCRQNFSLLSCSAYGPSSSTGCRRGALRQQVLHVSWHRRWRSVLFRCGVQHDGPVLQQHLCRLAVLRPQVGPIFKCSAGYSEI